MYGRAPCAADGNVVAFGDQGDRTVIEIQVRHDVRIAFREGLQQRDELSPLDRYTAEGLKLTAEQLSQPGSARAAIRTSLLRHAAQSSGGAGRRGCLVVAMATEQAAHDPEIAERTRGMFARLQQLYAAAIVRGQTSGEFPERDAQAMALFLVCQIQGMRVLGKTGVAEADMVAMVENTLRILD